MYAQLPLTPVSPAPAILSPGYAIGTILHGTNNKIGNLWIITVDHSYQASLLFDGKSKIICQYIDYKRDQMRPGMVVALPQDVASLMGGYANIPTWAKDLILSSSAPPHRLPTPSTQIPFGAMAAINAAIGTTHQDKLASSGMIKMRDPDFDSMELSCNARKTGSHVYQPYYGFTDTYEYCIYCDHKRGLAK